MNRSITRLRPFISESGSLLARRQITGSHLQQNTATTTTTAGDSSNRSVPPPPPDLHDRSSNSSSGSTSSGGERWRKKMRSWEIHTFGGPCELQFNEESRVPIITSANDVLIQVRAASINPIDVAMSKGYGSELISSLRKLERGKLPRLGQTTIDFPIVLGRDFAGVVSQRGAAVTGFDLGDEVYGVLGFTEHGSHADFVVAKDTLIRKKPQHLSFAEAASFPYVGLTCWSALKVTGMYCDLANKRVLVLGGSGGVGTFAVQYLRANGAQVVTTCSPDAVPLVEGLILGAGAAIDYTQPDHLETLKTYAPFDCILNVSGPGNNELNKLLGYLKPLGQFITLSPPMLSNYDQYGPVGGTLVNAFSILKSNLNSLCSNKVVTKWAFFIPSSMGLADISSVVESGKILPVIEQIYKFPDLPRAFERVESGHLRGKIIVEM